MMTSWPGGQQEEIVINLFVENISRRVWIPITDPRLSRDRALRETRLELVFK